MRRKVLGIDRGGKASSWARAGPVSAHPWRQALSAFPGEMVQLCRMCGGKGPSPVSGPPQ